MKIIIGSDHAGFELKERCRKVLVDLSGIELTDVGVYDTNSSDYPKIAHKVSGGVHNGEFDKGILICGSGIGMSMVANRYEKVRAALCHNIYTAKMCRLHNDANILVMGDRVIGWGLALEMLDTFLNTEFEGGRHQNRLDLFECGCS